MGQTEAQRAAAERNLRKGNPNAYSKAPSQEGSLGTPRDEPVVSQGPPRGKKRIYRGRGEGEPQGAPGEKPARSQGPPRDPSPQKTEKPEPHPAPEPKTEPPPARSKSKPGLFDDVIEALF